MWINVDQKDIDKSNKNSSDPVSLALYKQFGKKVCISRNFIKTKYNGKVVLIELPKKVKRFLLSYKPYPAPFRFQLPASAVRLLRK